MKNLKCPICGKPTYLHFGKNPRRDGLCAEHGTMANNMEIKQCDKCGKWHYSDEICECLTKKSEKTTEHKCPICESVTKNKYICNDCYKKVDNHTDAINKNTTIGNLREYYSNLKWYIYRSESSNIATLYNQLTKLFAIADLAKKLFNKEDLFNKVFDDISDIKIKKINVKKDISEEEKIRKDINTAGINRAKDGHFVKSEYEVTVDDILFDLFEVHVYEKIVAQITERAVVCDWYIPVYRNYGIYIELWGIDKNVKYDLNKEEKRSLYKKHGIPLIEIEKDELRGDTSSLANRLEQEIIRWKQEIKNRI